MSDTKRNNEQVKSYEDEVIRVFKECIGELNHSANTYREDGKPWLFPDGIELLFFKLSISKIEITIKIAGPKGDNSPDSQVYKKIIQE